MFRSTEPGEAVAGGRGHREPALSLLLARHGQHQGLPAGQREPQLVLLTPAVFGHVDDVAQVQRQVDAGGDVLGALVTL